MDEVQHLFTWCDIINLVLKKKTKEITMDRGQARSHVHTLILINKDAVEHVKIHFLGIHIFDGPTWSLNCSS